MRAPAMLFLLALALPAQGGLERFEAEHGQGWVVWNGPGGGPYRVFGPGAQVLPGGVRDLEGARSAVRSLMERHGEWLGAAFEELEEVHAAEATNLLVLDYVQRHRGVPVWNAFVEFRFNKNDGGLSMLGSQAVRGLDLDPTPALDRAGALAALRAATGWSEEERRLAGEPRLEIYPDVNGIQRLAWRLAAELDHVPAAWTLWIDARNGRLLGMEDALHHARMPALTGTVRGMCSKPPGGDSTTNPPQALPLPGVLVNVPGVGQAYTDAQGMFTIPYTGTAPVNATLSLAVGRFWLALTDSSGTPVQVLNVPLDPAAPAALLFNPSPSEYLTAQVNGVKWVTETHDYIKRVVPTMTAIDQPIRVRVNYNNSCNAFYSGDQVTFYRKAGNCYNTASASVVAHEYGHYVDARNGGIGSTPRTPSEGIADAVSILLLDDPIIGRDFNLNGSGIRDARNSLTHPLTGSTQAVHTFGQPFMGFCWDFLTNCRNSFGPAPGYAFAETAVLESILANPKDMLDYLLQLYLADDDDSNLLNGTPRVAELSLAALKRHFIRPEFHALVLQHTPLADVESAAQGFLVSTGLLCRKGAVTGVDLFFDNGSNAFARYPMALSGGSWQATTGPVGPAKIARYYLEARNDLGNTARLPAEAGDAFVVAVGRKRILFQENAESAAAGFTPSNGSSLAGWARHIPFGRNYDPPRAAGGSYAWGVNRSATDERVPTSAATATLTSRTLDTRGQLGTRLRFRRWLTADANSSARLLIGGAQVASWSTGNDQDWRTFDLDVSAWADGRPAVTIVFESQYSGSDGVGGLSVDDVELYTLAAPVPGSYTLFGSACKGSAASAPALAGRGLPLIGQSFQVELSGAPPLAAAVLVTGASRALWGAHTLPLDLAGFGAPGCSLHASIDLSAGFVADWNGAAIVPLSVPGDRDLLKAAFFHQFLVIAPGANQLGVLATSGAEGRVGS